MRKTGIPLRLSPDLHKALKDRAEASDISLNAYIVGVIEAALSDREKPAPVVAAPVISPTPANASQSGIVAALDLTKNGARNANGHKHGCLCSLCAQFKHKGQKRRESPDA